MIKKYPLKSIQYSLLYWSIFMIVCLFLDKLNSFNFISVIAGFLLAFIGYLFDLKFKYENSKQ